MESFLIQRATRRQASFAGAIALLILLALAVAAPCADWQWPAIAPFMPMCALTVFTTAGIAAFLLGAQFTVTRQPMLAALGGAYAFTAVAVALQLLMFPGVFSPTGLFGARPTSAVWMWVFWHGGFPLFVIIAVLVRERLSRDAVSAERVTRWAWLLIGGPVAVGDTPAHEAQALAERAREAVLRLRIDAAAPWRYVTVSAGCATAAPGASVSVDGLVESADAALYQAKAAGRNLVMSASAPPAVLM